MRVNTDDPVILALVIAAVGPALAVPVIGNPANLSALILLGVVMRYGSTAVRRRCLYLIGLVLVLALVSTAVGLLAVTGFYSLSLRPFGVLLRIVACACAVGCVTDLPSMRRKLLWITCGASLFAILQFLFPSFAEFTSVYYLAPERSEAFTEDFSGDVAIRVIGVYENPSSVALMALASMLVAVHAFRKGALKPGPLALFLLVHLAAGLLSLSKIFVVGLPILLAQLVLLRFGMAAAVGLLALAAGAAAIYQLDAPMAELLKYATDTAIDPSMAVEGRYLPEQRKVVSHSWVFGYGLVNLHGAVINDSAYLVVGYMIGVFGGAVLGSHLAWWIWTRRRRAPATLYLLLATALLAGVGANSVLGFRVDILFTALFCSLFAAPRLRRAGRLEC